MERVAAVKQISESNSLRLARQPARPVDRDRSSGRITPRIIGDDTRGAWRSQDVALERGQRSQTCGREVGGKHTGASQAQHCPGIPPTSLPPGGVFRVSANRPLKGKTPPSVRSRCPAYFRAMPGYGRGAEYDPFASRYGMAPNTSSHPSSAVSASCCFGQPMLDGVLTHVFRREIGLVDELIHADFLEVRDAFLAQVRSDDDQTNTATGVVRRVMAF